MPETITAPAFTSASSLASSSTLASPADDSARSHLDAARSYFPAPPASPFASLSATTSGTSTSAAASTTTAASNNTAAATTAEDIAAGIQAPPENVKSHAGWQELKKKGNEALARARTLARENEELKTKLQGSPATVDEATRARLHELEAENQTISQRLKVLDLRAHPEFVQKFVAPQNEARAALAKIVQGEEGDIDIDALLARKGKAFQQGVSDALDTLTPYGRVQFQSALDRYLAADLGAQQAEAQAGEFLKTARQSTGARSRAAFDRVAAGYREHFVPVAVDEKATPEDRAAAEAYNTALAAVPATAESYAFGELNETAAAELANKAALFEFTVARGLPRLGQLFNTTIADRDAKIATLEAQLKSLTAAQPTIAGGAGAGTSLETASSPEDHLAAARRYFPGR